MAKFLLLNREEEYVQTLKNVTVAKGNKIINGEDTLDLTIFDTEIEKNYRILLQDNYGKWHEYIVQEIEETHTDKGIRKKVYCESSIYETIGDFVEDRRFNNTSALMALTGVLQHTRWEVGRVDNLGTESYSPYRVDAKTAIQTIAKTWKGELQTRIEVSGNKITGRYIDLLNKIGNNTGKRFSWTKDIQQIKRTVVRDDVITALYGFGKGEEVGEGFGRRVDFADINGGKMYVEDNEAKEQFGRLDENGNKVHIFGKVEFDDETEKSVLKKKTEAELEVISKPLLSYSADVLDLKQFGYEHEGYELGDTVLIIDKEFKPELRVLARIIEKETDYLEELNSNVTLGNFIPTSTSEDLKNEGYINNFRDKSGVWDRSNYISEDGRIFIDDLLDQLNAKANATGGYFYYTEGEGIITTDKPIDKNPTKAVEIKGGSIRIADSKLPDGSWNWRTAMTGDGITLDAVNTGTLTAGRIFSPVNGSYWDLESGVLDLKNGIFRGSNMEHNLNTGVSTYVNPTSGEKMVLRDGVLSFLKNNAAHYWIANDEGVDFVPGAANTGNDQNAKIALKSLYYNMLDLGIGSDLGYKIRIAQREDWLEMLNKDGGSFRFVHGSDPANDRQWGFFDGQNGSLVFGKTQLVLNGYDDTTFPRLSVLNRRNGEYAFISAAAFDVASDRSLKTDVEPLQNALGILADLRVYEYNKSGRREIGVIADESPTQMLSETGKSVNLYSYISLTHKALLELSEVVYAQEEKMEKLQTELINLKAILKEKGLI